MFYFLKDLIICYSCGNRFVIYETLCHFGSSEEIDQGACIQYNQILDLAEALIRFESSSISSSSSLFFNAPKNADKSVFSFFKSRSITIDRGLPTCLHLPGGTPPPGSPRKISISSTTRDLCSLGWTRTINAEVPGGAKAGLLAGPTLEDY